MACKPKEDHDAHEATHTRRDRIQAAPGRCSGRARNPGGGRDPRDWGHRGHVLPLAPGVRRPEVEPGQAHEGAGDRERSPAQSHCRPHPRQADPAGSCPGKLLSPARRRACVEHIRSVLNISERRACRALGQPRPTWRKAQRAQEDEERLTADLIELARQYGRYGYRKIAALLRDAGWLVNDKRVERIWRREGLKVPPKQPKRGRLWRADGSCIRLRPEHRNHVWSYDFVEDRTHDGRKVRILNVLDEFTHECLAIRVDRKLKAIDVIDVLSDLFISAKACPVTSVPTMDPSSWPKRCRRGSRLWAPRRRTSSAARRGRTGLWGPLTPGCGMSCWMGRSSTHCGRLKS